MALPRSKTLPPVKKRFYVYVLLAVVLVVSYFFYVRWAGPLYEGSRTRIWVQSVSNDARAWDVVLEIGPDAVPFILEEIDRKSDEESKFLSRLRSFLPNFIAQRLPFGIRHSPRWKLLELLQQMPIDERAGPQLIKLIATSEGEWGAIYALGKLPRLALPQAGAWLASSNDTEQLKGLHLAGALGPAGADLAPQLAPYAYSPNENEKRGALSALAQIGPPAASYIFEIIASTNGTAGDWLFGFVGQKSKLHAELLPELMRNTTHSNFIVRARSVRALAKLAPLNGEAKAFVRARLEDENAFVRVKACHALVRFATNTPQLLVTVQELIGGKDPEFCAIALGRLLAVNKLQFTEKEKALARDIGFRASLVSAAHLGSEADHLAALHLAALFPDSPETRQIALDLTSSDEVDKRAAAFYALTLCAPEPENAIKTIVEAFNRDDAASIGLPALQFIARQRPQTFEAIGKSAIESASPQIKVKWLQSVSRQQIVDAPTLDLVVATAWFKSAVASDQQELRWPF